jgi:hypothetical protein
VNASSTPPPRWRGCLIRSLQIIIGLILVTCVTLYAVYYFSTLKERSLTSNLPGVDRIEVESLNTNLKSPNDIVAARQLTGTQTEELAHLWRRQSYRYWGGVMCHDPIYRVRFYRKDAIFTEATICFHCDNIYFYKFPGAKGPDDVMEVVFGLGLAGRASSMAELHTFLDNLFPNPKDRPIYDQR